MDLIDKKHTGILSILDEQCRLAKCTERSFANAIYEKCSIHERFDSTPTQRVSGLFSVNHYAGPVEYTTASFLEKNKDQLPQEATELLQSSSNPFLIMLARLLTHSSTPRSSPRNESYISSDSSVASTYSTSSARNMQRKSSSLSRASVGSQFAAQLQDLRQRIDNTSPHYIRCLKPNDELIPDHFESMIIADQLRCAGVLEAVRVSRVGYPQVSRLKKPINSSFSVSFPLRLFLFFVLPKHHFRNFKEIYVSSLHAKIQNSCLGGIETSALLSTCFFV